MSLLYFGIFLFMLSRAISKSASWPVLHSALKGISTAVEYPSHVNVLNDQGVTGFSILSTVWNHYIIQMGITLNKKEKGNALTP